VSARAARGKSDWLLPSALIGLSLVPSLAGGARLEQLATGAAVTPENARFFASPIPVVLHVLAVVPYSMLGAVQFAPGLRRRYPAWHRLAGRVLLLCALVTAITGLWMAQFYEWPAADGEAVYLMRLIVGTAMLASIAASVGAIRRRDFHRHGEWMIRAYALAMGAGTQVLTHLPWFVFVGQPTETPRAWLMGLAWAINAVVAERVIRMQRHDSRTRRAVYAEARA
jgi:uncharacterized membrane protein